MIKVSRDTSDATRCTIRVRDHAITADVAAGEGGGDAGPDPHDLYDAALGACKALTMIWYANRRGIALGNVEVRVERDASQEREGTYRLRTEVRLDGDLDARTRDDLLRVATKCPVHKLMTDVTTEIETVFAADD